MAIARVRKTLNETVIERCGRPMPMGLNPRAWAAIIMIPVAREIILVQTITVSL